MENGRKSADGRTKTMPDYNKDFRVWISLQNRYAGLLLAIYIGVRNRKQVLRIRLPLCVFFPFCVPVCNTETISLQITSLYTGKHCHSGPNMASAFFHFLCINHHFAATSCFWWLLPSSHWLISFNSTNHTYLPIHFIQCIQFLSI